jgi:hypothetical protein
MLILMAEAGFALRTSGTVLGSKTRWIVLNVFKQAYNKSKKSW